MSGLSHLTLIDGLFLVAPALAVPLGLRLITFEAGLPNRLLRLAIWLQPVGAVAALVSFLLPRGPMAAMASLGWLGVCAIGAFAALFQLLAIRTLYPVKLAPVVALAYMAFGAVWFVLSRGGIAPLGLDPAIVELTAVHFHFTGFAAVLLAGLALAAVGGESPVWQNGARASTILLIAGSPVLAAGWGTPVHTLQILGAILVALGVVGTAAVTFFKVGDLEISTTARTVLRLSSAAPIVPMVLAVEYSAGHIVGFPTLDIQGMALIHGNLNALGFSLLGLFGWRLAGAVPRYR